MTRLRFVAVAIITSESEAASQGAPGSKGFIACSCLLVPLDDSILFPGMTATIAADVGDAEQVFLLPRPEGEYGAHRHDRRGGRDRAPARRDHRRHADRPAPRARRDRLAGAATASSRSRSSRSTTAYPAATRIRELERNYRAVVEEILELRGDDGRVAAFLRSISEPGPLADTSGYSPDISLADKQRLLETVDVTERLELALELQRERLAELQVRRRIRDDVESGAQAQQREYFLRKQMESIRKELGEDDASVARRVPDARSTSRRCPTPSASRPTRELGRLERMGEQTRRVVDDPHLPRLAARRAVGRALRREARPGRRPRGARRRPRRPRGRQGPDHRVHRRPRAAPRPRPVRRGPGRRRDPDPDRPSRHRQDLDRRVDRPRDRARVRPHVAGRRPRRGRDPRPPPHLHRRPPGPPGARAQGREDDEPGDHARRGRQGRRRLARRPRARPCSRSSTRRRTTPSATTTSTSSSTSPRSCSSPRRTSPRRSPGRCSTGWRWSASTATRPTRRSRSPAATCGRARSSATACATTRSRSPTRCSRQIVTEYTREAGVRGLERELGKLLRKTATRIASERGEGAGHDRRPTPSARRSASSASSRRRPSGPRSPASPPGSRSPAPAATCCSSRRPRCRARRASCSPASSAT